MRQAANGCSKIRSSSSLLSTKTTRSGVRSMALTMLPVSTGWSAARTARPPPRPPRGLAAGEQVEHGVLRVGDHVLHRVQVRLGREQPGDGPRVLVDAEAGQIGVADVREQPLVGCLGRLVRAPVGSARSRLVADLDDTKRLVDREPVAGRVVDRLVMRHDLHQVVGVTASGARTTPRQNWSIRIVRIRSSLLRVSFSRCSPAWTCSANLSIAILTAVLDLGPVLCGVVEQPQGDGAAGGFRDGGHVFVVGPQELDGVTGSRRLVHTAGRQVDVGGGGGGELGGWASRTLEEEVQAGGGVREQAGPGGVLAAGSGAPECLDRR